jgi:hypothetical protein
LDLLETTEDWPLDLLVELRGASIPIIFCEGINDKPIYQALFPKFKIKVTGGKGQVKSQTRLAKARRPELHCYGIVDGDYENKVCESLIENNIYTLPFPMIENFIAESSLLKQSNKPDNPIVASNMVMEKIMKKVQDDIDKFAIKKFAIELNKKIKCCSVSHKKTLDTLLDSVEQTKNKMNVLLSNDKDKLTKSMVEVKKELLNYVENIAI